MGGITHAAVMSKLGGSSEAKRRLQVQIPRVT
jgi:hypothetical protein